MAISRLRMWGCAIVSSFRGRPLGSDDSPLAVGGGHAVDPLDDHLFLDLAMNSCVHAQLTKAVVTDQIERANAKLLRQLWHHSVFLGLVLRRRQLVAGVRVPDGGVTALHHHAANRAGRADPKSEGTVRGVEFQDSLSSGFGGNWWKRELAERAMCVCACGGRGACERGLGPSGDWCGTGL